MNRRSMVAAFAALALAGCASLGLGGFREPLVYFNDAKIRGLGLSGGSVDVVLSVYNPNGFNLNATRLTYKLMVEGNQLGEGQLRDAFRVQSKDSTFVTIPVNFTYAGLGAAGRQLLHCLEELPDAQRAAFLLHYEDGASVEDLAQRLGLQFETARSRLRYALQKLRGCMRQYLQVLERAS